MQDQVKDTLEDQLLDIFRRSVKKRYRDRVAVGARLQADLDMDSLGVVSCMLVAEEELSLRIFPLEVETGEIRTVGDVVNLVRSVMERA
jgi:acyl carrier protein